VPAPRCQALPPDAPVTTVGGRDDAPNEEDDPIGLPFAVELGSATPLAGGYVVGAMKNDGGTPQAVAIVMREHGASTEVALGEVHGNVVPPRVSVRGDRVVVGVVDGAAIGTQIRLGRIDEATTKPKLGWGSEIAQGDDDSPAFAMELSDEGGALAWDEWDKKAGRGRIVGVRFGSDLSTVGEPSRLSEAAADAEGPQLAARPGGFWLAWIENLAIGKDDTEGDDEAPSPGGLVLGPRRIVLAPLSQGVAVGKPITVTEEGAHALTFDLAPSPDGGAIVAWRDDRTSPANSGGVLWTAKIAPDGSVARHVVGDEDIGGGALSLIELESKKGTWLAFTSATEAVRLAVIGATGAPSGATTEETTVRGIPIAGAGGRLLLARPRGRSIELATVRCRP
jgi:hypothetical protein